jgi:cyclase
MRIWRLSAIGLLAIAAVAQEKKLVSEEFETVEVAKGVIAFIAPEPAAGIVQGNSTAIIGSEGVLVVDTGQFPSITKRHIAEIRKRTHKPVKFVLFTHWHGDHNFAARAYQTAFPGVTLISTAFTRQLMESEGPKFIQGFAENAPRAVETISQRLQQGKRRDGTPLTHEQKLTLRADLAMFESAQPEFKHVKNTPAEMTFDKDLTIHLGEREVQIKFLGRANTAGDAVTWIPDEKVLITGDTVVYPTPYGFGCYFREWPAVLQKMMDMNATAIVPGHGPVMKDYSYMKTLIALFDSLNAQVKAAVAKGANSEEEVRKQVKLDEFAKQLAGENPYRKRAFAEFFVQPAVGRAYEEAMGKMKPEGL